ncbi:MAG TPA: SCO family protein [Bacteroidia bacterium]|jgi:protein SCO1|nr:SCO family protein [Bacteroidia bacterium]
MLPRVVKQSPFRFIVPIAIIFLLAQCQGKRTVRYLPILGVNKYDPATKDTNYHTVADFKLTDQFAQIVTADTFKNKIYVANFFFATCPGICKQMNSELERVEKVFAGNSKVKFISHTVTPDQDSVPVLAQYALLHDAIPYQWYFLTGNKKQIIDLAIHSYLLETDGYLVHSQNLTLVDTHRRLRGVYSGTVPADVDRLIKDINVLLKEEKENSAKN